MARFASSRGLYLEVMNYLSVHSKNMLWIKNVVNISTLKGVILSSKTNILISN